MGSIEQGEKFGQPIALTVRFAGHSRMKEEAIGLFGQIRCCRSAMLVLFGTLGLSLPVIAQEATALIPGRPSVDTRAADGESDQYFSQKMAQLLEGAKNPVESSSRRDYQIGPEDLLEISVLEAPDLSRTVRVSDDGAISLPLLGSVEAAGLSPRELEKILENLLQRTYMKNPQVSVFVKEMRSHPVSVFGAVEKPGVYQIRSPKTLIEVLSMAQGLADEAGDTAIVMRHGGDSGDGQHAADVDADLAAANDPPFKTAGPESGPSSTVHEVSGPASITVNLKDLLDSNNPRSNVLVYPGDAVKVTRAGIVYVVGDVHKPGGFLLKTNENISVLQAIALAEGITPTSKRKQARIILAGQGIGSRKGISINLDKILAGKAPDPLLGANDILFVPTSSGKAALHGFAQSTAMIVASVGGAAVYRW